MKKILAIILAVIGISFGTVVLAAPCAVIQGCTGLSSVSNGGVLSGSTTQASLNVTAIGTPGTFLRSSSTAAGLLDWTTPTASLSGGINGYLARWTSASALSTGIIIDNGTVAGVNASSSGSSLNVQGTAALNPFRVASSTGTALLTVAPTGSTTVANLAAGLVRTTSGGSLFNGSASLTSDVSGVLPFANGGTNTSTSFTSGSVIYSDGAGLAQNNSNFFWDKTNGRLGIGTSTPAVRLQIQYSDNAFLFGIDVQNTNLGTTALTGIGMVDAAGLRKGQFVWVPANYADPNLANSLLFSSTYDAKLAFVSSANGTNNPDIYFKVGTQTPAIYILGSSNRVGIANTSPGALLDVGLAGSTRGVIRVAGSSTGNVTIQPAAAAGTWTMTLPTTAGSNLQFLQTDGSGVLTFASANTGAGTNGQVAYFTAANVQTSSTALLTNGTVAGVKATSSTVTFNVQGNAGTSDIINFASSTGTSLAKIDYLGFLTVSHIIGNSGTPTVATSTAAGNGDGSASIAGTDMAGQLTVNTGNIPTSTGTIATITFAKPFSSAPYCVWSDANGQAAGRDFDSAGTNTGIYVETTTTTLVFKTIGSASLGVGLFGAVTYKWNYHCIQ